MRHTALHPRSGTRSRPIRIAGLALTSAALVVGGISAPSDATAPAAARTTAPVIVAHVGRNITLSRDTVRAGQVTFKVVTRSGTHELQLARLRHGYTLQQAGADIGKAFGGDVAAVNRVDRGVDFRGGAEAHPNRPGEFTAALGRGHYLALDQDGNGLAFLTVRGSTVKRVAPHIDTRIDVLTYGFESARTLPRTGRVRIHNTSDQPHFVVLQRVKEGTTRAQVKKTFSSMSESKPSWALPANTSTGVISPNRTQLVRYALPAGEYVIACFWPDRDTGMPHAYMGMWKIVHLR